jgi:hypothetical protein
MSHLFTKSGSGTQLLEIEYDTKHIDFDVSSEDILENIDDDDALELCQALMEKFHFTETSFKQLTPMEENYLDAIDKLKNIYHQLSPSDQATIEEVANKYP